jgi:hypothetical protein
MSVAAYRSVLASAVVVRGEGGIVRIAGSRLIRRPKTVPDGGIELESVVERWWSDQERFGVCGWWWLLDYQRV